jgi:hypothetical protein
MNKLETGWEDALHYGPAWALLSRAVAISSNVAEG